MAAANPANSPDQQDGDTPVVDPTAVTTDASTDTPVEAPGPVIEYLDKGAEKVQFTINPKAIRYVVRSDGQVLEYL
jgi:hypothetical protein